MPEALWLQVAGVDYSAAEDRRLIKALSTAGVVEGLVITATSGTGISVSAGTAIIDTGTGEGYVAYTTAATTLTLPVSSTTNVFIKVDTATALVTVGQGTLPTAGTYLLLATVATNASTVTSTLPLTPTTRALPVNVSGQYLKLSGGVVTGEVQATSLHVPNIIQANATLNTVNMPKGARLGGSAAMSRCFARAHMEAAHTITSGVWTTLNMTAAVNNYGYQGGTAPYNTTTNRFTCPVAGVYAVMGNCYFADPAGTNAGRRIAGVMLRRANADYWFHQGPQNPGDTTRLAGVNAMMDCLAGDTLEMRAYQDQGTSVQVLNGSYAGATETICTFTLVQAF